MLSQPSQSRGLGRSDLSEPSILFTSVLLGMNRIWTWSFVGRYWPMTSILLGAGCYRCSWRGEAARPDGLLPRGTCAAPGCLWLWLRAVGRPGAACPAPPGTLNLFCFLVSARQPYSHRRFAPGMREGGELVPARRPPITSDDVGRRPFVGCPNADAPPVIAREMEDSAPTTRSADGAANGQQPAEQAEAPQRPPPRRRASRGTPDGATHRWSAQRAAAPAPRVVARARACAR